MGSHSPCHCCVTLGKSLHLSEPHFPFQRESYTLVHGVAATELNENYVTKTYLTFCVVALGIELSISTNPSQ